MPLWCNSCFLEEKFERAYFSFANLPNIHKRSNWNKKLFQFHWWGSNAMIEQQSVSIVWNTGYKSNSSVILLWGYREFVSLKHLSNIKVVSNSNIWASNHIKQYRFYSLDTRKIRIWEWQSRLYVALYIRTTSLCFQRHDTYYRHNVMYWY